MLIHVDSEWMMVSMTKYATGFRFSSIRHPPLKHSGAMPVVLYL